MIRPGRFDTLPYAPNREDLPSMYIGITEAIGPGTPAIKPDSPADQWVQRRNAEMRVAANHLAVMSVGNEVVERPPTQPGETA